MVEILLRALQMLCSCIALPLLGSSYLTFNIHSRLNVNIEFCRHAGPTRNSLVISGKVDQLSVYFGRKMEACVRPELFG